MNEIRLECFQCQRQFEVDPDEMRPYHGAYIQGNRPPEYLARCPSCNVKNVLRLPDDAATEALVLGKPPRPR